jgi:hypothetical protein
MEREMTDEERQKLCAWLRDASVGWNGSSKMAQAADEIERLAAPAQSNGQWQVKKQSSGEVLFTGESWEEANEAAKLLTRTRHYNHNLLIIVKVGE